MQVCNAQKWVLVTPISSLNSAATLTAKDLRCSTLHVVTCPVLQMTADKSSLAPHFFSGWGRAARLMKYNEIVGQQPGVRTAATVR
jgi:hypothetical protein